MKITEKYKKVAFKWQNQMKKKHQKWNLTHTSLQQRYVRQIIKKTWNIKVLCKFKYWKVKIKEIN